MNLFDAIKGRTWATGIALTCFTTLSLLAAGCREDDEKETACGPQQAKVDGVCQDVTPTLGWVQMFPGGDTTCARDTEFSYWVHPGKVNKLLVYFEGGGACWNAETCGYAGAIFTEEAPTEAPFPFGIFDFENPNNPFKDWYAIQIPYCTGDVHWGNNVMTYPALGSNPEITIHHKGFVNGTTVLNWAYDNFPQPENIFVTGCSAGAYGSAIFAPYLIQHYPDVHVAHMADSGAGVITSTFFQDSFPAWKALENLPSWITDLANIPLEELSMSRFYAEVSNFYPDHVISQYNTAHDWNQGLYFIAMGGTQAQWDEQMEMSIDEIHAQAPSFRSYTAWGKAHCIVPLPYFYNVQVNGVRFSDWVGDIAEGRDVSDVKCTDCDSEEYFTPAAQ